MITLEIPIKTVSEANSREHWRVKNKRKQNQQAAVWFSLQSRSAFLPPPILVTLERIGKRLLDDDNLASSFKGIRDMVAAFYCLDDGDTKAVRWKYSQSIGRDYAIRITISSRKRSPRSGGNAVTK